MNRENTVDAGTQYSRPSSLSLPSQSVSSGTQTSGPLPSSDKSVQTGDDPTSPDEDQAVAGAPNLAKSGKSKMSYQVLNGKREIVSLYDGALGDEAMQEAVERQDSAIHKLTFATLNLDSLKLDLVHCVASDKDLFSVHYDADKAEEALKRIKQRGGIYATACYHDSAKQ